MVRDTVSVHPGVGSDPLHSLPLALALLVGSTVSYRVASGSHWL